METARNGRCWQASGEAETGRAPHVLVVCGAGVVGQWRRRVEPNREPAHSSRGVAMACAWRRNQNSFQNNHHLLFLDKSKYTISGHVLGGATPVRPLWAPDSTHVPPSSLLRSIVDSCNPPSKDSNILLILQSFHYYSWALVSNSGCCRQLSNAFLAPLPIQKNTPRSVLERPYM